MARPDGGKTVKRLDRSDGLFPKADRPKLAAALVAPIVSQSECWYGNVAFCLAEQT
jgi:hypothetical protein